MPVSCGSRKPGFGRSAVAEMAAGARRPAGPTPAADWRRQSPHACGSPTTVTAARLRLAGDGNCRVPVARGRRQLPHACGSASDGNCRVPVARRRPNCRMPAASSATAIAACLRLRRRRQLPHARGSPMLANRRMSAPGQQRQSRRSAACGDLAYRNREAARSGRGRQTPARLQLADDGKPSACGDLAVPEPPGCSKWPAAPSARTRPPSCPQPARDVDYSPPHPPFPGLFVGPARYAGAGLVPRDGWGLSGAGGSGWP